MAESEAQPILALDASKKPKRMTANLLPCRINHDGPLSIPKDHWSPSTRNDSTPQTAYFRGRKLLGTTINLPKDYRGVIAERAAPAAPRQQDGADTSTDADADADAETAASGQGLLVVSGEFDGMVVWGHEAVVDGQADPYTRGMNEWVELASEMHCTTTE